MKVIHTALGNGSFILDLKARNLQSVLHQVLNFIIGRGLLAPVQLAANHFFAPEHLAALDAEEEPEDEENGWGGG